LVCLGRGGDRRDGGAAAADEFCSQRNIITNLQTMSPPELSSSTTSNLLSFIVHTFTQVNDRSQAFLGTWTPCILHNANARLCVVLRSLLFPRYYVEASHLKPLPFILGCYPFRFERTIPLSSSRTRQAVAIVPRDAQAVCCERCSECRVDDPSSCRISRHRRTCCNGLLVFSPFLWQLLHQQSTFHHDVIPGAGGSRPTTRGAAVSIIERQRKRRRVCD